MRRSFHHLWACSILALAGAAQAAETVTYRYDELGRLTRVSRSGTVNNGVAADYGYDPADNRTRVAVSGVPTVVGGGFESPEVGSGFVYRPGGSPALFTGGSGVAGNGSVWGFNAAPEGDQLAFVQGGAEPAAIRLQVVGLTPGATYRFSFEMSVRPGYWGMPVTLSFADVPLGTFDPATTSFATFTSAPFTANTSSGSLYITASGVVHQNSGIDRVTIAPVGSE